MPALAYRTKLPRPDDPDILEGIYSLIANEGIPLRHAAPLVGISEHTAYHWVMDGEAALASWPEGVELCSAALFGQMVKEARAKYIRARLVRVHAGEKDWAANMTALERSFPQDFGRREYREEQRTVTHRLELPEAALASVLRLALQQTLPQGETVDGEAVELPTPQGE